MSLAMVRPPGAVYREEQWFAWWVYGLLAGLMAAAGVILLLHSPDPPGPGAGAGAILWSVETPLVLGLGMTLPPILVLGVLRMTTEVAPTEVRVWFGLVPTYSHLVPLDAIRQVEVVRYRPIRDCGGWGIRRSRSGDRVLNARGDRGVRLTLEDGSLLLIGSQRPEELAEVLDRAIRAAA